MNSKILNKCINILLVTLNLLFLIYYFLLAFYSHPHYDDLHFMWRMNEMSIFEYVKEMYFLHSGRFVAYGLNGVIFSVVNTLGFHQFWPIVFYIVGVVMCWLTAHECIKIIPSKILINVILLLYNMYILINIDFAVFNWLCAMSYYLLAPSCCLLLCYLNKRILKWYEYAILSLLVVFIGGGQEAFTPVVLLIMFFNGLYYWHKNNWKMQETWSMPQIKRIVYVAISLFVFLSIVVIAPGNYARMLDASQFVHPIGIIGWVKAIVHANGMYSYFMLFYLPYMLVLFSVMYLLGNRFGQHTFSMQQKCKFICLIVLLLLIYTLISSIPNVYLYGGFGIQRSYTHSVFILLLCISMCGFILGCNKSFKVIQSSVISVIGILSLIIIMSMNIYNDIPIAKEYSDAVNSRIDYLKELQETENTKTVIVKELPSPNVHDVKYNILSLLEKKTDKPSLYYISDADTIPNEYEYHFRKVYGLDFDFVIDK